MSLSPQASGTLGPWLQKPGHILSWAQDSETASRALPEDPRLRPGSGSGNSAMWLGAKLLRALKMISEILEIIPELNMLNIVVKKKERPLFVAHCCSSLSAVNATNRTTGFKTPH